MWGFVVIAAVGGFYSARFFTKKEHGHKENYAAFKTDALSNKENIIPVLVVGSGPSGLAAALYGARSGFYSVIFEGPKPGGQLMGTSYVENWPGLPKKLGPDLIKSLREQAQEFGAVDVAQTIKAIDISQWPYVVTTENDVKLHALTIVLATGAAAVLLDVPGAEKYMSWDKGISTCAICDAPFYKEKDVFVVGGGDSAAEEAMQLAPYAKKITLLVRGETMRASAVMQERLKTYKNIFVQYNSKIVAIKGDENRMKEVDIDVKGVVATVASDGIFLAIGHAPNSSLVKGQVAMNKAGFIEVEGRSQKTNIPGIFAAGDVSDFKYRQAGVAAGDGIKAALDAVEFLRMIGFNDTLAEKLEANFFTSEGGLGRTPLTALANKAEFLKAIESSEMPILVDIYTSPCPTCEQMLPILESLASEFADRCKFYKMDFKKLEELEEKYSVATVPTFLVFKKGQIIARGSKVMSLKDMRSLLEKALQG